MATNQPTNRLREWRKHRGLSLERLAEMAETSAQQISRLERRDRKLTDEWLARLSGALQVKKSDLLVERPGRPGTGTPGPRNAIEQDLDRRMFEFWGSLAVEQKAVVANFFEFWTNRRLGDDGAP